MPDLAPVRLLLLVFGGWVNRRQAQAIDFLIEENRVLKEQLRSRRLRLNDSQRRRPAAKGKVLGRWPDLLGPRGIQAHDEIFVLSDGEPNGNTDEILQVVREINTVRKIRINTVFAGTSTGAAFMKQLAEENGGVFVQQ